MSDLPAPMNKLAFLEEIRAIAQLGLVYTEDPYDRERYERLFELAAVEYSEMTGWPSSDLKDRFLRELGHVTPKVGVDAAIFSDDGKLLLIQRSDDFRWCLPCGWADLGETAQDALKREVKEETGLEVEVGQIIDVTSRLPGEFGPHTAYFLLYHCTATGGALTPTHEALKVGYYDPDAIQEWHAEHGEKARHVCQWWREHVQAKT